LRARLDRAVGALPEQPATPTYLVDLDAFDANAADLARRARGKPIRVATKSLRVPALVSRALAVPGFRGLLAYDLREALWLGEQGLSDDIVMGYPSVDAVALRQLTASSAARARVTLMVDDPAQLDLVDSVRACAEPVRVALDVDAGLQVGPAHLGPKRSPLREPRDVAAFAALLVRRPGFDLVGVMTYEGQVAGVPDRLPGHPLRSAAVRRSRPRRSPSWPSAVRQSRRRFGRSPRSSSGTPAARGASRSPPRTRW
jgi:D-serine deaminase-like pyridoxal phosphate-dependent protein